MIKKPDLTRVRAILIDIDNTLLDSFRGIKEYVIRECQNEGVEFTEEKYLKFRDICREVISERNNGMITREQLFERRSQAMIDTFGMKITPDDATKTMLKSISECTILMPGVEETLKKLCASYPLAIASNGIYKVQKERLDRAGITQYFTHIFVSDAVGAFKPSRDFYNYAADKLMLPPESILMIGDEVEADMVGAKNAGMMTCFAAGSSELPTPPEADYFIHSFSDLL